MGETFLHVMTLLAFRYVSVLNDFSKSLNLLLKFLFYSWKPIEQDICLVIVIILSKEIQYYKMFLTEIMIKVEMKLWPSTKSLWNV